MTMTTIPYNVLLHLFSDPGDPPAYLDTGELVPFFGPYKRYRPGERVDVERSMVGLKTLAARRCGLEPARGEVIEVTATDEGFVFEIDGRTAFCGAKMRDPAEIFIEAPDLTPDLAVPRAVAVLLVQAARFDRAAEHLRKTMKSRTDPRERVARFEAKSDLETFDVQPELQE
jgi:hypothetical protein